jgi:hypothetical protein
MLMRGEDTVGTITRLVLVVCVLAVVGGAVALASWDIPAPTTRVEKPIPSDRFK